MKFCGKITHNINNFKYKYTQFQQAAAKQCIISLAFYFDSINWPDKILKVYFLFMLLFYFSLTVLWQCHKNVLLLVVFFKSEKNTYFVISCKTDAVASTDQIRLCPSLRDKWGGIFSTRKYDKGDFQVELSFKIHGRGKIGADGLVCLSLNCC